MFENLTQEAQDRIDRLSYELSTHLAKIHPEMTIREAMGIAVNILTHAVSQVEIENYSLHTEVRRESLGKTYLVHVMEIPDNA